MSRNDNIQIDSTARVSAQADIEVSILGTKLIVGAGSVIDSFVKIKPAGGTGDVIIGRGVTINSGCVIYSGNGILIGNDVSIAAGTVLAPVNHAYNQRERTIKDQRFAPSRGGIVIEDDVWIGAGCVLLDGSILRKGVVVGAMSLVRGELASYGIFAGNPIRQIGWRE